MAAWPMGWRMFERGGIYLANLNPQKGSEVGKVRPVLVIQSDALNEAAHPTTLIIPLSTHLIDDAWPLRLRITRRERLETDSDLLIDQLRTVDNRRLIADRVAILGAEEMARALSQMCLVLGGDLASGRAGR